MTADYQGCTRGTFSGDTSSPDDQDPERRFPGSPDCTQICETLGQEGSGRYFCITGTRDNSKPREHRKYPVLETFFQKLSRKVISPRQATPGSVGYDIFTPIDFIIQPNQQKLIFTDLALAPPDGYYAQLMSKSGLMVTYELEVKAGVIDPNYIGNIGVVLKNHSNKVIERTKGEPIAQILFIKIATPSLVQVPTLTKTRRGKHGFRAYSA